MDLKELLKDTCDLMSITCFGVSSIDSWSNTLFNSWVPEPFRPASIFPEARSVITIGLPVHLPVLETAPSIWYREEYKTINRLLDQYTWKIASVLTDHGFASVSVPRDGYGSIQILIRNPVAFFSHRHAAVLAGLGTFGRNNMVLTRRWGPRVRFGSVLTTAEIEPDRAMQESLCTRCNACVHACPVHALSEEDYPDALTRKDRCSRRSEGLNRHFLSPCGICIKVCPVGEDRSVYGRKDARMYTDQELYPELWQAWEHVRRYGSDLREPVESDKKGNE